MLARLIVAVHKWGMIFLDQESFDESSSEPSESSPTKGVKIDKSYSMMYWREGIIVNYQAGNFLVESFKDEVNKSVDIVWIIIWLCFYLHIHKYIYYPIKQVLITKAAKTNVDLLLL